MINFNIQESLSILRCVNYSYAETISFDYKNKPRPYHNIAFMTEGRGIINHQNEKIVVEKGDILYIPKNTTYNAVWQANTSFSTIHFNFQPRLDPLLNKDIPVQKIEVSDFNSIYMSVEQIIKNQNSKSGNGFITLSVFYQICGDLLPNVKMVDSPVHNKSIYPAISYLENNFNQPITVEFLANLCFLSPSRFYYLFKQGTGLSPIVYKNQLAIQNASQELLFDKDTPIKEIAQRNGFDSVIYFERLFKKTMGKTPSQFKKEEVLL